MTGKFISDYPKLLQQWDYEKNTITPDYISYGSSKKVWWICDKGHRWEAQPNNRVRGAGCPYCTGRYPIVGKTDLQSQNIRLASEWDYEKNSPILPEQVTCWSSKKVWWKGNCGHGWNAPISSRSRGDGCPYCSGRTVLKGYNDLSTKNPLLAKEWNKSKNDISPSQVTCHSLKKVWWKGQCGHEWQQTIADRSSGQGCPYCSNRRVLTGFNDLQTRNPDIAKEWHPAKNGNLLPKDVTEFSGKKVWWLGSCGHEWYTTISLRTGQRQGCPYCSHHKVLTEFNDLATVRPDILKYWDYEKNIILPQQISSGSHRKVWWICPSHHSYLMSVHSKVGQEYGCPICSGKAVQIGENDLASQRPDILAEWHPNKNSIAPTQITCGSKVKVWWLGACGHEWRSTVYSRTNGEGCPICNREFKTSFPEQAIYYYLHQYFSDARNGDHSYGIEFDIYIPSIKTAIEYDGGHWHNSKTNIERDNHKNEVCNSLGIRLFRVREISAGKIRTDYTHIINYDPNQDEFDEVIKRLFDMLDIQRPDICIERDRIQIYAQYVKVIKNKSLAVQYPEIAKEWHSVKNGTIRPEFVSAASKKKVWWLGKCGHEWNTSVSLRTKNDTGCPVCTNQKIVTGINDLSTRYPNLIVEWDYEKNIGITPESIGAGTNQKIWWKCQACGYSWQEKVVVRTGEGPGRNYGCPVCSNHRLIKGYNDLATLYPLIANQWDYEKNGKLTPQDVMPGSKKYRAFWKCEKCGGSWNTTIKDRTRNQSDCPYCLHKKLLVGYNDLLTVNPILANEWDYEKNEKRPEDYLAGNDTKVWWICSICGYSWCAQIKSRNKGIGCPNYHNHKLL